MSAVEGHPDGGQGQAVEAVLCPDCHHQHTPTGCVGEPSPSDLWAGVDVAGCDCDDEARVAWWADQ